ncbi:hypothetical protein SAMN05660668_00169 [Pseudobutyrivibrio sp. AR14]|jgi:hypothetical protein|uniref:Uncharacterized protein n=1 Tax=Pseudobutyrivibrio ruminis TaxID=46206 RepID=A0A2G3EDL4_9FIRM|nr:MULTISPECIES: hypothetical protein [Pseudobutyrivibrio]PHU41354.1 hypothetical protein CSX00_00370 [Pseudobutyrivibrio ruminis]SCX76151.1 hypothetical protein SAMN05660668_00169 [Pseudobutyrivibrio sp. AR14]
MAKYNIGGYIFNDEESAKKAAKELKTVEYILGQIKEADEKTVLQIYNKLLKQRLFSTEIGLGFLSQLRQNLLASGMFAEDEVEDVYTIGEQELQSESDEKGDDDSDAQEKNRVLSKSDTSPELKQIRKLKIINSVLIVVSLTLLLCVIGMFYVSSTINSPTILNYEETITDQYSTWKQELDEREAELKAREKALEERENSSVQ